jgi:hypothetical protein
VFRTNFPATVMQITLRDRAVRSASAAYKSPSCGRNTISSTTVFRDNR